MLVVSEFIGCSPSLSGAIRVNPWDIDAVAEAMYCALSIPEAEKQLRQEKHYRYVNTHDVGYWAKSFLQDLERTCKDHGKRRCWGIGFGLGFRIVALDPNFKKLSMEYINSAYRRNKHRAIFLDYDGTLMPQASMNKSPSSETIEILNELCRDDNHLVFLVRARSRKTLSEWFSPCEKLGIIAEHEPVLKLYTKTTDGSTIEDKETSLVWSYEDADPDFGYCQAKELLDHLESILVNDPVTVKSGQSILEVEPQGVSKGLVAQRLLSTMQERGKLVDFVIYIGDDRSDEDMFKSKCFHSHRTSNQKVLIEALPLFLIIFVGFECCLTSLKRSKKRISKAQNEIQMTTSVEDIRVGESEDAVQRTHIDRELFWQCGLSMAFLNLAYLIIQEFVSVIP
ncbi:hypothetical protein GIB67_024154 [Kingdonia uniflora]|uniref:Trehalose-phosphatase n=1 Tax=Kingdonia uniflora TaxID=39325 RepID=A0A7J7LZD7_9MAGN|nr:hypothetical protein GIB67_024154 [Kingdonia uniflora]